MLVMCGGLVFLLTDSQLKMHAAANRDPKKRKGHTAMSASASAAAGLLEAPDESQPSKKVSPVKASDTLGQLADAAAAAAAAADHDVAAHAVNVPERESSSSDEA